MRQALARIATESDLRPSGSRHTRIRELRSGWPLMLRSTLPLEHTPATAWAGRETVPAVVHLSAGGAGPIGGDQLRLEVYVGSSSALILGEISPTLLLPGPHDEQSSMQVEIRVGASATLVWLPQMLIAAHGCRHRHEVTVTLDAGARLLLREEVLFGRYGEQPGTLHQRLRIVSYEGPVYDQQLLIGPTVTGWDGPAVTDGHRSVGAVVLIDPQRGHVAEHPGSRTDATVMPLPGQGILISALAAHTCTLRRQLDAALGGVLAGGSADALPKYPPGLPSH